MAERLGRVTEPAAKPWVDLVKANLEAVTRLAAGWAAQPAAERELGARPVADTLYHLLAGSLLLAEGQLLREQGGGYRKLLAAGLYLKRWLEPRGPASPPFTARQIEWLDAARGVAAHRRRRARRRGLGEPWTSTEIIWRPDPAAAARTRMAPLHGARTASRPWRTSSGARSRSPSGTGTRSSRDLGLHWFTPYRRVLDTSRGIAWPRWFEGGRHEPGRQLRGPAHGGGPRRQARGDLRRRRTATVRTLTYAELAREVNRLANALKRLGVRPGRHGRHLPADVRRRRRSPRSRSRASARSTRRASRATAPRRWPRASTAAARALLITADAFARRGQAIPMKRTADEAVSAVAHRRARDRVPPGRRRRAVDGRARPLVARAGGRRSPTECPALPVEADHPCLIIYTSGTTGRPKGTVLTHGGFSIKNAHDFAYLFDLGERDRLFWVTDLGWLMGPMLITRRAAHRRHRGALRGHARLSEARPALGACSSATASPCSASRRPPCARSCRTAPSGSRAHDLSSLRIIGSTGEPWNPEPYRWLFETRGRRARCRSSTTPAAPRSRAASSRRFPIAPIKPCSFSGPDPGHGRRRASATTAGRCAAQVGELVITRPWPGMTAGFWKDRERYLETYWSRWPDVWVHGDWAYVDAGRLLVHPGPLGRHAQDRRQARGPGRGRVGAGRRTRRWPRPPPSACRTRSRARAVVCFAVLRPGHAAVARRCAPS